MAQRRMFSLQVVDTDAFLEMPLSAQALYFHLGMRADDDGFVANAKRILRLISASEDDLRILLAKRFLMPFDSGIVVIKHWKISNYIQKDRYRPTLYKEEKSQLFLKPDGAYTDHYEEGYKTCAQPARPEIPAETTEDPMYPECIHRIGKDRLGEDRLGEVSLGKVNSLFGDGDTHAAVKFISNYFGKRCLNPKEYFGTTDSLLEEIDRITVSIFDGLANRKPTKADASAVFISVTKHEEDPATKEITRTIDKDALDLLLYAFEQAALAGTPGNWNYINGVLARLAQRSITNLADAELYDIER